MLTIMIMFYYLPKKYIEIDPNGKGGHTSSDTKKTLIWSVSWFIITILIFVFKE